MKKLILFVLLFTTLSYGQQVKKTSSVRSVNTYKASFYCLTGKTATGIRTRNGIVAADPRVLPLGTKISINGQTFLVADTGSKIKGKRLDIWVSSCQLAKRNGIRMVEVQRL